MILLFISAIFFHCDEEKANAKFQDLDYSTADFWWTGTPKFNATDVMTPPYPFLPTPFGHGVVGDRHKNRSSLNQTYNQSEVFPPYPNRSIDLGPPIIDHIQYPGIKLPPNFPSDYKFPTVLTTLFSTKYIPSPTGPTPKGPSFTLPDVQRPIYFFPTGTPKTIPNCSTSPTATYSPVTWNPIAVYLQMWKKKIALDAALYRGKSRSALHVTRSIVNYDWKTLM